MEVYSALSLLLRDPIVFMKSVNIHLTEIQSSLLFLIKLKYNTFTTLNLVLGIHFRLLSKPSFINSLLLL